MTAALDRAVERSRAADVEKHHATSAEPSPNPKWPTHAAMCDYTDEQAIDSIADVLLPDGRDRDTCLALWIATRQLVMARDADLYEEVRNELAAEIGNLIADAAEQYLRGAA